jgi:hypothetical protein
MESVSDAAAANIRDITTRLLYRESETMGLESAGSQQVMLCPRWE